MGAIGMAGREKLDNLVFVVNANLQRLDGPVRGNGKIIQELEAEFRGAGWNVIKVIWGSRWDALFARDKKGILKKRMMELCDGDYQTFRAKNGAYIREHFFNTPELKALVADWTDEEIWELNRGGHDIFKVHAAYKAAVEHEGQPTVILAKTIKGYGMGQAGEAMNIAHQAKKMDHDAIRSFRDRFRLPVPDDQIDALPFLTFAPDSPEARYMHERRQALGGYLPQRRQKASESLEIPPLESFASFFAGSGEGREISTTMALVRMMIQLMRDKKIGKRVVPIVPDESRTFGMEGMFRQFGIWNQEGQKYVPEDHDQLMFYKESRDGQILEEGINEAGATSDWIAAATSYSVHDVIMIPFRLHGLCLQARRGRRGGAAGSRVREPRRERGRGAGGLAQARRHGDRLPPRRLERILQVRQPQREGHLWVRRELRRLKERQGIDPLRDPIASLRGAHSAEAGKRNTLSSAVSVASQVKGSPGKAASTSARLCPTSTASQPLGVRWRFASARMRRTTSSPSSPAASASAGSWRYS
jgi:hypothetical protein